jgi:hypothetical protein
MRGLIAFLLATLPAWGAVCTSRQAGNWNDKATWGTGSGCVGASGLCSDGVSSCPALGDTATVNHAVTQNVPNLIIGVNGAAPLNSYLSAITGGGGTGYTSCGASLSGGTGRGGGVRCDVVKGEVTPAITSRGSYSVCPTITITASGGSGATLPGTISCAAAGGTAAIKVGSAGKLTIGAITYIRGTLQLDGAYGTYTVALLLSPGAALYLDMSQAPAGAIYRVENTNYARGISADCTSQQCSIHGLGGATSLELTSNGLHSPFVIMKHTYLKAVGDSNMPAITSIQSETGAIDFEDNTFDGCGSVITAATPTGSLLISGNVWQNSPLYPNANYAINLAAGSTSAKTTGTRQITGNVLDGTVGGLSTIQDYAISGNYFGQGIVTAGTNTWASFTDNFVRVSPPTGANYDGGWTSTLGNVSNVYYLMDPVDGTSTNIHWFTVWPGTVDFSMSRAIVEDNSVPSLDSGEWFVGTPSAGKTAAVTKSLQLCDSTGFGHTEILSTLTTNTGHWMLQHNTICGGYGSGGYGAVQLDETRPTSPGTITFQGNLIFNSVPAKWYKLETVNASSPTADVCVSSAACDYNGSYNLAPKTNASCAGCTNQAKSYATKWTSETPGEHDVDDQDPRFVDRTRKVENFDRKYLGKALSPQWVSGTAYAFGDLASNSDANVFQGEPLNFRCINPSGCTGQGGPGIPGTAWRANWEWASLYWLRELTYQKAMYTDGAIGCSGCSAIQALNAWVFAGFAPQNPAYWGTGHDGKDIGAVDLPAARHIFAAVLVP